MAQEVVRSTLPVRGLPVAYSSWGLTPGASEIVLCFHGFLDHGDSFAPLAEVLAQRLPVVALDFRGFGRSGWIGDGGYYHFMDYVADVERLHTHLGSPAVHLLAHSMGGSVATTFTSVRPEAVRSLVMLEGMGPPREDLSGAPSRLRRWVDALAEAPVSGDVAARRATRKPMRDVEDAAQRLCRTNPRLSPERARALAEYGTEPHDTGGVVWRFDPLHRTPGARPFNAEEYAHHWREVKAPVLSLYGDDTEWALGDLAERHGLLADCVVGVVAGSGHNLHHDQPAVVAEAASRWIAGDRRLPDGVRAAAHDLR